MLVCVRYLHKLFCVLMELLQYRQRLFRKAVFKNALDDSAAIRMSGEGKDLRDAHNYTCLLIQHIHQMVLLLWVEYGTNLPWFKPFSLKGTESPLDYSKKKTIIGILSHTLPTPAGKVKANSSHSFSYTNKSEPPCRKHAVTQHANVWEAKTLTSVRLTVRASWHPGSSKLKPFISILQKVHAWTQNLSFNTLC